MFLCFRGALSQMNMCSNKRWVVLGNTGIYIVQKGRVGMDALKKIEVKI